MDTTDQSPADRRRAAIDELVEGMRFGDGLLSLGDCPLCYAVVRRETVKLHLDEGCPKFARWNVEQLEAQIVEPVLPIVVYVPQDVVRDITVEHAGPGGVVVIPKETGVRLVPFDGNDQDPTVTTRTGAVMAVKQPNRWSEILPKRPSPLDDDDGQRGYDKCGATNADYPDEPYRCTKPKGHPVGSLDYADHEDPEHGVSWSEPVAAYPSETQLQVELHELRRAAVRRVLSGFWTDDVPVHQRDQIEDAVVRAVMAVRQ